MDTQFTGRACLAGALRFLAVTMASLGLLAGCNESSDIFLAPNALDADNDGSLRYPWGGDFDDDGDGQLQFIAGGADYDDTNAAVQANAGTGAFGAPAYYAVGAGPTGVYLADFDVDGNLDVLTSNQNDSTATVYFGIGDGTFASPVTLTIPNDSGGSEAVTGDFDEDGLLDVVVGSHNYLFLNAGNRTFGAAIDLGSNGYRNSVRDVNGDGHLDIVGANYENGVTALLGAGDGTFGAPVNSGAGIASEAVAVADFDGDGVLDTAMVTFQGVGNASNVVVLLGDGTGGYENPVTTALPNYGWQIAAADLDGDGHADVVATDTIFSKVYVLLGDGAGGFGPVTTYDVSGVERMAIADYNGDTVPDLAVTSQTDGLWLASGNGDGSFGTFALSGLTTSAFDTDAGDLDNDGILDLVVIDISGNRFAVQLGS